MAAAYTVTLTCRICGSTLDISNTEETTGTIYDAAKPNRAPKCPRCKAPMNFKLAILEVAHSEAVGSNTTITHTITNGSISSAVS